MFNDNSTKKRMVWPWDHPYELQWKMFYDLFMNWTVSEQIETGFCKEDLLMIILFYLNQLNLSQNLMRILIYSMLICIFHWKEDKIISCPFYMWKFFDNKVNLIQQFIENLPLAACIFILVVFYQWYTNLVWYTLKLVDVLKFIPSGQNFMKSLISRKKRIFKE